MHDRIEVFVSVQYCGSVLPQRILLKKQNNENCLNFQTTQIHNILHQEQLFFLLLHPYF